jgi:AcrR family transcriptional regulator
MVTHPHNVPDEAQTANETEKRLMESALSLFSEKGYEGASIREIIERAGVTRPVLYYYFENKEQLFCRLVESWFLQSTADMDAVLAKAKGYRERLKALILLLFEKTERSPEVVRLIFQVFLSPSLAGFRLDREGLWRARLDRVAGIMREGLESGEFRGKDPETLAIAFCGMMDYYVMVKVNSKDARLSKGLADALVDVFLEGAFAETSPVREA